MDPHLERRLPVSASDGAEDHASTSSGPAESRRKGRRSTAAVSWRRWVLFCALMLVVAALASRIDVPAVATVRDWFPEAGPARWLAAAVALSVVLVVPAPRSALSLLAGAMFGLAQGLALVLVSGLLGALAGFFASRWVGRTLFPRGIGKRLARVDDLFDEHGLAAVLTARMAPAPPFAVVSYAAGLSSLRVGPYMAGTAIGLLPGSVFYVTIGASVTSTDAWLQWLTSPWLVALAATMAGTAATVAWRRRLRTADPPSRSGDPLGSCSPPTQR